MGEKAAVVCSDSRAAAIVIDFMVDFGVCQGMRGEKREEKKRGDEA